MKKRDRLAADDGSSVAEEEARQHGDVASPRAPLSIELKGAATTSGLDGSVLDDHSGSKEEKNPKLKKHPGAPKRFRTAFIIFSQHRHGELRAKMKEEGAEIDTINVARMVSYQWREMSAEEKEKWEEMAKEDKARYMKQKEEYAGPWKVAADMKKPKDPTAPKKPTPAYFSFSNERRQIVKKSNPTASNGEISKMLSKMWKEADGATRAKYVDKEKEEREHYNKEVEKWKKERKDNGKEHWWELEQQTAADKGNEPKRAKLDMLADAAPQHQATAEGRFDPTNGNISAIFQSQNPHSQSLYEHQLLVALSSGQPDALQIFNALFPQSGKQTRAGQSSPASSNPLSPAHPDSQDVHSHSSNPQMLSMLQQLLFQHQQHEKQYTPNLFEQSQYGFGGNGGVPLSSLLEGSASSPYSGDKYQTNNYLASLLGGSNNVQHPRRGNQGNSSFSTMNDMLLTALLRGRGQQQEAEQQQNQSLPVSLLQQALPNSVLQQLQSQQSQVSERLSANYNSALSAFLRQQVTNSSRREQQCMSSQATAAADHLTHSLLQNLLQHEENPNSFQEQQLHQLQQQQSSGNVTALQELLSRFVREGPGDAKR